MSLRVRLTVTLVAIVSIAVVGLGLTAYFAARRATLNSVDQTLQADVRSIESSFEHLSWTLTGNDIQESRLALDRLAVDGLIFQVRDQSGTILYSSVGNSALVDSQTTGDSPGWRTTDVSGRDMRILISPIIRIGQSSGSIEVRAPLDQAYASIRTTRDVLVIGGLVAILISAGVASYIAGKASRPVEALARLAKEIEETADFSRRLPADGSYREMKDMADTFNQMISRVDEMVAAQRHFLSDTSHELRRPLTILRTNIDILTDPGLSRLDLEAVQSEMRSAAGAMSNLVTELLILARQNESALVREPLDFVALCQSVLQDAAANFRRHSFEFHAPREIWIEGDRQRLERMVGNVLVNAATYAERPATIMCSVTEERAVANLVISDTGPGMSGDELDHLFDRFYRGDAGRRLRPEGSGLGLPIVQQVARSHGGDVAIVSEVGCGTTVTITMPACITPPQ